MSESNVRPRTRQGAPGQFVLPFGSYKGRRLHDIPIDYLNGLRKAQWLWPATRKAIVGFLAWLAKNPGEAKLPFGKYEGEQLDEVDTSYLDWTLGNEWVQGYQATSWLISAELRKRCGTVLVYVDPFGPPIGRIDRLHEVEDREPFDTRGFIPSDCLSGTPGKRGWRAFVRRPREAVQAEDDRISQDLHLPPMPIAMERKARNRVYWASTEDGPVIKSVNDEKTDASRLRCWDRALEAIEGLNAAQDMDDLHIAYTRSRAQVGLLAQAEGWNPDSNQLIDDLDDAYRRREEILNRQEVSFTDADHRVEGGDDGGAEAAPRRKRGRARGQGVRNLEPARVHEAVRRMRGCRTVDDLFDVALGIRNNLDLFGEEGLANLRAWYAYFKAALTTTK